MSIDSELVVVCHCKKHSQLYYADGDKLINPLGDEVQYVDIDPECPEANWDAIKTNSKLYVWGYNCPVAYALLNPSLDILWTQHLLDILINSWRVLKNGGKVILGINKETEYDINYLQGFLDSWDPTHKWVVSSERSIDFTFSLGKALPIKKIHPRLILFTKVSAGGNRRKRTTRKRKGINRTRRNNK